MKKITIFFMSLMLMCNFAACGSSQQSKDNTSAPSVEPSAQSGSGDTEDEGEQASQAKADETSSTSQKTLVVYYSATGNTEEVAGYIAEITNGDMFELEPSEPYSDADLNWTDESSRVVQEHDNPDDREVELVQADVPDWESYSTVFIGYPIWWGIAAWPVDGFIKANDFTGKTVVPFCTSSSSGLGESGELLAEMAGTGNWLEGERFASGASKEDVQAWAEQIVAADQTATSKQSGKILVAYFSAPEDVDTTGVDAVAGASIVVQDDEKMGNMEYTAKLIQETVNGDLFSIGTVDAYPLEHEQLVDQAADEQDQALRPELSSHIENLEQYDTIILGFPNWWGDLPMPVYSFLEEYDFGGKTIVPVVTHGGSGFSNTQNTISQLQPDAIVDDNTLSLSRDDVAGSEEQIRQWAKSQL